VLARAFARADEDAIIFQVTDEPLLAKVGLVKTATA